MRMTPEQMERVASWAEKNVPPCSTCRTKMFVAMEALHVLLPVKVHENGGWETTNEKGIVVVTTECIMCHRLLMFNAEAIGVYGSK